MQIVASLAGTNLEVITVSADEAKKSSTSFPYIKTAKDEIIFEASAIAAHLARMNPNSGLSGVGAFQEASVNQWVAWAECSGAQVSNVVSGIQGKTVDAKRWNDQLGALKKTVMALNAHLKGKKWIVGDKPTIADVVAGVTLAPAFQLCFDSGFRKGHADLSAWFERFIALPEVVKHAGQIKMCAKSLKPAGVADDAPKTEAPAKAEKKEAAKKEDDDLDLFGDDDEADAEAAKKIAEAAKEKAKGKAKKVVIAQSLVMFEVKPLDSETDLDALAQRVINIKLDGCYWKTQYKKEPVAFGIFKLIIGTTVEDEKVSVDDLVEMIEGFDDMVQSVDILAFNKI